MSSDLTSTFSQRNLNAPKPSDNSIYEFDRFRLDAAHRMLYENNQAVPLKPKVVETLLALVEKPNEIISKDELMNRVWSDSFVEESNLTQNIYLLRKTLGKAADGRDLIETFRRRGYRFNGEIKKVESKQKTEADAAKRELETGEEKQSATNEAATVAFAASGASSAHAKKTTDDAFDSLAVLPFANKSADADAEFLSDGVTESVINRLSQISTLRVVARNTVFQYKNREVEPQTVGRALGVGAVLTGRVLQHGERLIVRAELVDAASGFQIWGEQYERRAADVLELQETIAREISENLHLKLSGEEQSRLTKRYTENTEAYRLFIKARYFLNKRLTESIEQAAALFQQAIDLDPTFAPAYVGLADCYPLLSLYGALTPHEAYPKARAAAEKALEIDDAFTKAYNSLGVVKLFYEWDWTGAETAFRKAIELNPGYPDAHQRYGMLLTALGRFGEAEAELEKAERLDPLSLITKTIGGYPFYYSRRYARAAEKFREVIEMNGDYSMAHFRLGLTRAQQGNLADAVSELETANRLSNDRDSIAALAFVEGLRGDRQKAAAALAELDRREKSGFVTSYNRALVSVGLNDKEAALDWLEKAFAERSYWLIYLQFDPPFDGLRETPRFVELQGKIFGRKAAGESVEKPKPEKNETIKTETIKTQAARGEVVSSGEKIPNRKKWLVAAAAACALLLVAAFVLPPIFRRDAADAKQPAATAANVTLKRLTPDIYAAGSAISPDGKYLVYVQRENEKHSLWVKDIATGGAKQILPPSASEEYQCPLFSPGGSQIYFTISANSRPTVFRIPLAGGTAQEIAEGLMSPFAVSPDNKQIAFVREQSLIVAETDGSKREKILSERDGEKSWFNSWGSQLSFSPDGTRIAVCGGRRENGKPRFELIELAVSDAGERKILVPDWDYLDGVQWLPDATGLIVVAREVSGSPFQLWRVPFPSAGKATRITQDFYDYKTISIFADSRRMVAGYEISNRNIWIAPLADARQAKQITFGTAANDGFFGVALTPDASRVVYTSPRSGNLDLWTVNADGSNQKQLTANAETNTRPSFSPDGRYIFFNSDRGGKNLHVWRIDADGGNPKQITGGEGSQEERPVPAPDGSGWVYFNRTNGLTSSIWKIPSEGGATQAVRVSSDEYESVTLYSVSPDGALLAVQRYDHDAPIQWQNAVMQAATGKIVEWFDQPMFGRVGWTLDSKSLIYIEGGKAANLWQQPIAGGAARRLTDFDESLTLRAFDISKDGKTLVVSRGNATIEAALIENF